jgi:hypothetical protein
VGGDSPRYAGTSETHEVSCCSNIALPGFSPPVLNCPVYAERDGKPTRRVTLTLTSWPVTHPPLLRLQSCASHTTSSESSIAGGSLTCLSSANWTFANAFCRANRARLCTNTELVLGCGANLGCSFNSQVRGRQYEPRALLTWLAQNMHSLSRVLSSAQMIWSATPNPNCQSAPTQLPTTLQPTGAPTPFNSCPGYKIQSGRGGTGNSGDGTQTPRFAGLGELHETTCCSPSAIPGFAAPVGNCTVYSERDAGTNGINTLSCHSSVTWTTAWTACNSIGARLCTATELQNSCGRGLGCQSDAQMIWSSTVISTLSLVLWYISCPTSFPTVSKHIRAACHGPTTHHRISLQTFVFAAQPRVQHQPATNGRTRDTSTDGSSLGDEQLPWATSDARELASRSWPREIRRPE